MSKQALWECINWYMASWGTEHESQERKVLDQAIDAALGVVSNDKLREAAEKMDRAWTAYMKVDGSDEFELACDAIYELRAALAVTADAPLEVTEEMVADLEIIGNVVGTVVGSPKGSIGAIGNTYIAQVGVNHGKAAYAAFERLRAALKAGAHEEGPDPDEDVFEFYSGPVDEETIRILEGLKKEGEHGKDK